VAERDPDVIDCDAMTLTSPRYIGVDVGGTKTLSVLVELPPHGGRPHVLDRELLPSLAHSDEALGMIVQSVNALMERDATVPAAIGVGLAGFVDRRGIVRRAPNTPGLVGVDVAGELGLRFDLPTLVDNDANCAAVAAHRIVGGGCESLVAVTLGTGIGGGVILDGKLLRGANGFAGEPGHMVIDPDGPLCPCGQRGCWETYASGTGLARLAREAAKTGRAPRLLELAGSLDAIRGEHVTGLLDERDPGAVEVFREFAGYVALGVANLVMLLDPEAVVIGGGMSSHGDLLEQLVGAELESRFTGAVRERNVRIMVTPGGPEAGAIGAAILGAYRQGS
jgi:glucokinase